LTIFYLKHRFSFAGDFARNTHTNLHLSIANLYTDDSENRWQIQISETSLPDSRNSPAVDAKIISISS